MQLIDGKKLADDLLESLKQQIAASGKTPVMAYVLCTDDEPAHIYARLKTKAAERIGVEVRTIDLPVQTSKQELQEKLTSLSEDQSINGIIVQLPLFDSLKPATWEIMEAISPGKDIDGLTSTNQELLNENKPAIMPATVKSILKCLEATHSGVKLAEWVSKKRVLIVNDTRLVGKPLASVMHNLGANVDLANEFTPNIPELMAQADIVITATGQTDLFTADMFKQNAIAIDVTSIKKQGKIVGDIVINDDLNRKISWITPVPGGVGPLTIACLLENLAQAALK